MIILCLSTEASDEVTAEAHTCQQTAKDRGPVLRVLLLPTSEGMWAFTGYRREESRRDAFPDYSEVITEQGERGLHFHVLPELASHSTFPHALESKSWLQMLDSEIVQKRSFKRPCFCRGGVGDSAKDWTQSLYVLDKHSTSNIPAPRSCFHASTFRCFTQTYTSLYLILLLLFGDRGLFVHCARDKT